MFLIAMTNYLTKQPEGFILYEGLRDIDSDGGGGMVTEVDHSDGSGPVSLLVPLHQDSVCRERAGSRARLDPS